jgi:UDP-N-acetylmuramoylalanine--D-glutamate ligase
VTGSLRDKQVLVVGLGRSGRAAARLCLEQGARVKLTDRRSEAELRGALGDLTQRCALELGGHRVESFSGSDLIVVSPGVPPLSEIDAARDAGVPLVGEVELASRYVSAPIVGITGTNGKSTTTELVGAILAASGIEVFCGGNLGQPLSEAVSQPACSSGVVVLELSSFQLETVSTLRAHVAVLLNLSEDHLDRYADYDAYKRAKGRLFERQTAEDFAVLNGTPRTTSGGA